jgi:hypothetical protein
MGTPCSRNSGIVKPLSTELAAISTLNTNYDVIDAALAKGKWDATADPAVTDDSGDGYSIGSIWVNVTAHKVFIAEDVTVGAALWRQVDNILNKYDGTTDPTTGDDSVDGYAAGSVWINVTDNKIFIAKSVSVGAAVWDQVYPQVTDFAYPPYDVIVRLSGTSVIAEDSDGTEIDSGTAGTDDTVVLQAGIDATPDGGVLYIGPGTYENLVADTDFVLNSIPQTVYACLLVTGGKNIHIRGAGIDSTILKLKAGENASGHPAIMILNRAAGELDPGYTSFEVSDMTLDGLGQDEAFDGAALILTGSTRSGGRFFRLKLRNYYTGLYSGNNGSGSESDLIISDIICEGIEEDGVIVDTGQNVAISNIVARECGSGVNLYGNTDYETRDPDHIVASNITCLDAGFTVWCINNAQISNVIMNVEGLSTSYGLLVHDSIGVRFSGCQFIGPDSISGTYGKASHITAGMDGAGDVDFSDCYFSAYNALQVLGSAVIRAQGCRFRGTSTCIYLKDIDAVTCAATLTGCLITPVTTAKKWDVAAGASLVMWSTRCDPETSQKTESGDVSNMDEAVGFYQQALINGEFQVNQQSVSPYTSGTTPDNGDDTYLFDQWILLSDGDDIVDVSQETSIVPPGAATAAKFEVETANKKFGILQIIENVDALKLAGKAVSLQFKARTTTGKLIENIRAAVLSWDSTANTVTSDVVSSWEAEGSNPTLATHWTAENTAANLALVADTWTTYRIENVKVDTANMSNLAVFIWVDDGDAAVDDLLYISQVQLNIGAKCAPYRPMKFTEEIEKCYRFWESSYSYGTAPATASTGVGLGLLVGINTNSAQYIGKGFRQPKPGVTTITIYNYQGSINKVNDTGSTEIGTTVVSANTERNGLRKVTDAANPFTVGAFYQCHWVADARL